MRTIFVLGFPKSGTTWLARLLGDILDSPVGSAYSDSDSKCIATEGQGRSGDYYIRQGHLYPADDNTDKLVISEEDKLIYRNLTNEIVIYMRRDPRDIMVSASYHWGLPIAITIKCAATGTFPLSWGGGFIPYAESWRNATFKHTTTRYKVLLDNTEREITRILTVAGIAYNQKRISPAVCRQSFQKRKEWTKKEGDGLPYGKEFQCKFLRRGKCGSWRDEMDRETAELMQLYFGGFMLKYGYITGPEWINEIEP
jgi:Sulfotransferase domain